MTCMFSGLTIWGWTTHWCALPCGRPLLLLWASLSCLSSLYVWLRPHEFPAPLCVSTSFDAVLIWLNSPCSGCRSLWQLRVLWWTDLFLPHTCGSSSHGLFVSESDPPDVHRVLAPRIFWHSLSAVITIFYFLSAFCILKKKSLYCYLRGFQKEA